VPHVQALRGGCATRVVIDERLGRRLLVDDHEPLRAANHVFELFILVTRDKGEAIILAPNLLVFGDRHLDPPLAGNVFVASGSALAKKSKRSSSAPGRASSATRSIRSFTSRISASFRACLSRRDSTTIVLRLSWPPDKRLGDSLVTVYPLPPEQPSDELLEVERGRTRRSERRR